MDFQLILSFLKKLAKNNNREWFEKNKAQYEAAKNSFETFALALFNEMVAVDPSLATQDPKKITFRIYRDVRFSKDKTPYKKNMSAGYSGAGKNLGKPGYYLHIEPNNQSFIAAGMYMPPADDLAKIRQEIDYSGEKLEKILKEKTFRKIYGDFWKEDALKTAPKGYAKDHPYAEWIKLKSYVVTHPFTDAEVTDKKFLKNVVSAAKVAKPLNYFLTEALE